MSITTSPSITSLAPALSLAQGEVRAAGKSGNNSYDKYTYSKLEDFLHVSRPILAKHGLALLFSVRDHVNMADRPTKNQGIEHVAQVMVDARIVHTSGEWIQATGVGEGQDRADKSLYKAITGAKKYLLAGLLAIPTSDDPEEGEHEETVAPPLPRRPAPIKTVDTGSLGTRLAPEGTTLTGGTVTMGTPVYIQAPPFSPVPPQVTADTSKGVGVTPMRTITKAPKKLSIKERYDAAYETLCEQFTMAATEAFVAEIKEKYKTNDERISAMEKLITTKEPK